MDTTGVRAGVRPESPAEEPPARSARPPVTSGGLGAVVSAARHSYAAMGALRSLRVLAKVNQREGFDCPGCAWPEPDRDRSVAEFCENGAKAIAEEATVRRAGPDLFAR